MTDNLLVTGFILIFVDEVCRAGKCDLVDVLVKFFLGHTKTVIHECQSLILGRRIHLDLVFLAFNFLIFAHHCKLL